MTVRMTHPNLPGQSILVPPDAVSGHRRSGWTDEDLEKAEQVEVAQARPAASPRRTQPPEASTGKE